MATAKNRDKTRPRGKEKRQRQNLSQDDGRESKRNMGHRLSMELPESLKNLTKTTSRVVQQAASILEEEIAAGIVAAKEFEERFINVKELRSKDPAEVTQKLRRDGHEVIDMLLDLVSAAADSIGRLAEGTISLGQSDQRPDKPKRVTEHIPTLRVLRELSTGESGEVEMALENSSDKPSGEMSFHASDLISTSGDRIVPEHISFKPSSLMINPGKTEKVLISVKVPTGTSKGVYSGLIQSTNLHQLKAILVVHVI